jgi:hypothetical protein
MLLFTLQAIEQCSFSLFLLFLRPSLSWLYVFKFFAGSDGGNYITDNRFVLSKGFPARRTNRKMLPQPSLLVTGEVARGRSGAEL